MTGDAELADEDEVQGGADRAGHLESDGDAASGEGQHDHVGTLGVGGEPAGEGMPRLDSVAE